MAVCAALRKLKTALIDIIFTLHHYPWFGDYALHDVGVLIVASKEAFVGEHKNAIAQLKGELCRRDDVLE